MPVSPTDFYAYAQATGTPVPRDAQAQAALAPAVFQWRKSQLQNRDKPDGGALGKIAGGIGALGLGAAGIYGARRGLQALKNRPVVGLAGIQETAAEAAPAIRKVTTGIDTGRTTSTVAIPQQSVKSVINEVVPEETVDDIQLALNRPSGLTREGTPVPKSFTEDYLGEKGFVDSIENTTSVEIQNARNPLVSDQSVTATNSSANQQLKEFASDVQVDIDSIANKPLVVQEKLYTARDLTALTPEEQKIRIMSAGDYPSGSAEVQALLNPNISTAEVRPLLNTTPRTTDGRQLYTNPTSEVVGGARASMTDIPDDPSALAGVNYRVIDEPNVNTSFLDDYIDKDLDPSAGIQGTGGPLLESEAYKEIVRGKGAVSVPGKVIEDSAIAPGSVRLERKIDEVIPLRRDAQGNPTSGVMVVDDSDSFARLRKRDPDKIEGKESVLEYPFRLQTSATTDSGAILDLTGSKDRIIGNVDPVESVRYFPLGAIPQKMVQGKGGVLQTVPGQNIEITQLKSGRLIPMSDGKEIYDITEAQKLLPLSQRYTAGDDLITTQPYMLDKVVQDSSGQPHEVRVRYDGPLVKRVATGADLKTKSPITELVPATVSRSELQQISQDASETWQNPTTKANWLAMNAPGESVKPYHRDTYIAQHLQAHLAAKRGINLPILKDRSARSAFIKDLTKTPYDSDVYGRPIGAQGKVDYEQPKVKVAGQTQRKGLSGVSPMELEDTSSEPFVSYYSPRVETGIAGTTTQKPVGTANPRRATLWDVKPPDNDVNLHRAASQDSIDTLTTKVNQLLAQSKRRAAKGRGA